MRGGLQPGGLLDFTTCQAWILVSEADRSFVCRILEGGLTRSAYTTMSGSPMVTMTGRRGYGYLAPTAHVWVT
jgi:hypothetical protein